MAKRKLAAQAAAVEAEHPAHAMRLPMMSAASALGPATRPYRSSMASALTQAEGVIASQMGDDSDYDSEGEGEGNDDADESANEGDDEGADVSTDGSDDVTGDASDGDDEESTASA